MVSSYVDTTMIGVAPQANPPEREARSIDMTARIEAKSAAATGKLRKLVPACNNTNGPVSGGAVVVGG